MKKILIAGFGVISLVAVSTARAGAATSSDVTTLTEVVVRADAEKRGVTASKTSTPLKDIPASVVVVPQAVVKQQGTTASVDTAIRNVSGVTQSSSSNYGFFNNYLIRGLNMNFLRDGTPDASTVNGYSRSLLNVDRVEVLKGPGSSLYGTGSPGGSVNLVTKAPQASPAYEFEQSAGSFETYQTAFDLTGPVGSDGLLYRFDGGYYTTGGFRGLERESVEALPSVVWKPTDAHTVRVDFDYRDLEVVSDTYGIPFRGTSNFQPNELLNVPREFRYYTPFSSTDQEIFRLAVLDEAQAGDTVLVRQNFVVQDRDLYLLRNAGGTIAAGSSVMTGRSLREQTDHVTDYLYQLEPVVDFETWGMHHKMLNGFEVQYHDLAAARRTAALPNILDVFNPVVPETSYGQLNFANNFERYIEALYLSLYTQDQIDVTDRLKVRVGGRADRFDTGVESVLNSVTEDRQDTVYSGQAGAVYELLPWNSVYGGIGTSQLAILSTESAGPLGKPENSEQIEIGDRASFFDDRVHVNVALYQVTRENFLVTIGTETVPVGEQETRGIDVDVDGEVVPGWNLYFNYAFQDAELVSVPGVAPGVGGNRPTGIPVHSGGFFSTYEFQDGPLKGFGFGGGLQYRGPVYVNQQNTSEVPDYWLGDLVFFYRRDSLEVQINVANVGDATYYRNGVNSGALPGDPLSVLGTVRVRF